MPGFIKRPLASLGRKLYAAGRGLTLVGLIVGTIVGLFIAADRAFMTNTRPSQPPDDTA